MPLLVTNYENYLCIMDVIFNITEIDIIAKQLIAALGTRRVLALHGDMGVGKTTLSSALCKALGTSNAVSSPTFSIINEYTAKPQNIYHIDLYRLKDEEEALQVGVEDCFYSGCYCLVEWPSLFPQLLPDDTAHIQLSLAPKGNRHLLLKG